MALAGSLGLTLAACGASAQNAAGQMVALPRACDERALDGAQFAVEAIPGAAAGYARQEETVTFSGCTATLSLSARVLVQGQILDEEGRQPVAARIVATRPSAIVGLPPVATQTVTNSSGAFMLALAPGTHQLRVLPEGMAAAQYPPVSSLITVVAGAAPDPLSVRLARGWLWWRSWG